jgi:hypothetical protein
MWGRLLWIDTDRTLVEITFTISDVCVLGHENRPNSFEEMHCTINNAAPKQG